jgi:hypothetical protein
LQGDAMIEMNIGDQGHTNLRAYFLKRFGGVHCGHRDPNDIDSCSDQSLNLRERCLDITGLGVRHTLHAYWRIAAYGDIAHHNLPSFPARYLCSETHLSHFPEKSNL